MEKLMQYRQAIHQLLAAQSSAEQSGADLEVNLGLALAQLGIPKEDIMLGLHPALHEL
jgi:hypothetical protein